MEKKQLTSVFMALRQRLRTVALGIVGEQEADDALQEAFCRLWLRSGDIADSKAAEGMSLVTVRHVAIDERRKRRLREQESLDKRPVSLAESAGAAETLERFEEIKSLIFSRMDERQADILWKRDYQEWDFKEIAVEYGLTEANVRKIVSRARKEIRELIKNRK